MDTRLVTNNQSRIKPGCVDWNCIACAQCSLYCVLCIIVFYVLMYYCLICIIVSYVLCSVGLRPSFCQRTVHAKHLFGIILVMWFEIIIICAQYYSSY